MNDTKALLRLLTPYTVPGLRMERWGPTTDGGYVLPADIMKQCSVLLTGGVGDNLWFEADVAAKVPNMRMALFDHTIAAAPTHIPAAATWHSLGLSGTARAGFATLRRACDLAGLTTTDTLVLKLDIESAEWEVLAASVDEILKRTSILIIEYHDLSLRDRWKEFRLVLEKVNAYLLPIHVHGNNYSSITNISRYSAPVPDVIEVTYINRNLIQSVGGQLPTVWDHDAPTLLDKPNKEGAEDYRFNYWSDLPKRRRQRLWQQLKRLFSRK